MIQTLFNSGIRFILLKNRGIPELMFLTDVKMRLFHNPGLKGYED